MESSANDVSSKVRSGEHAGKPFGSFIGCGAGDACTVEASGHGGASGKDSGRPIGAGSREKIAMETSAERCRSGCNSDESKRVA
jgi:hypothetical protein